MEKYFFSSDYMEGTHPKILERLQETNLLHTDGYKSAAGEPHGLPWG